jgi:hypothetical protein
VNRCWWQLISHKYLRLGGPLYLTGCLAGSLALASASPFFRFALAAQILALSDPILAGRLTAFREAQTEAVHESVED